MVCGVSVVCECIDWLIAVEIWGWCDDVYGMHTVHIVHTVRTVYIAHTALTVHNVRPVHTLLTVHTVHLLQYSIQFTCYSLLFLSHSFMCPFPFCPLRNNYYSVLYCIGLFLYISLLNLPLIVRLPH